MTGVLLVTAALGAFQWHGARTALAASEAVSRVADAYFQAMGAQPGTTTFVEPANPETARAVREEYAARLAEAAEAYAGTAAAVEGWLLVGQLRAELGRDEEALAGFERAAEEAGDSAALRGLALLRLGSAYESAGRFEDAARSFEEASAIQAFPLARQAMALAARAWARAGSGERAAALADRVRSEPGAGAPDEIPAHLASELDELRAAR